MRVAAIDMGSNSTRLLVADVDANGVVSHQTDLKTTRLGQGMSRGILQTVAMERTIDVVLNFMQQARQAGAEKIVLAATSAVRDAANRHGFTSALLKVTGQQIMVLSGQEEARLVYLGVTAGLGKTLDVQNALVVDVGGGSTEFIWPSRRGQAHYVSVPAGAVRMTGEGFGQGQVRRAMGATLKAVKKDAPGVVIGVGGTVTTLAAMAQGLVHYDSHRIHGFQLRKRTVDLLFKRLVDLPRDQRSKLPGLQPQRADIIPAGTWIVSRILHALDRDTLLVSETDLLHGLALIVAGVEKMSK